MSRFHGWPLPRHRTATLLLVILLMVGLDAHLGAQPLLRQPTPSATAGTPSPSPDLTATTEETPSPTCEPSATAGTPSPSPDLTATTEETPSPTCEPSATAVTPSPTIEPDQATPSISAAALITSTTPTETPTSSPPATSPVTPSIIATPPSTTTPPPLQTPTPVPTPSDGVICPPRTEIVFTGEGPPRTALLLAFERRIV